MRAARRVEVNAVVRSSVSSEHVQTDWFRRVTGPAMNGETTRNDTSDSGGSPEGLGCVLGLRMNGAGDDGVMHVVQLGRYECLGRKLIRCMWRIGVGMVITHSAV